ncbi:MAG: 50S ribosomal protein L11 methyltransferase, partial [Clostridia bacterium]|nr:50S ribosomal protein L11 methyltransferase [Clostridia bacterium]
DIDPVAVKVARENALADGCDNVTVGVSDLLRDVDLSGGKYDFCVANIVADIIIRMMPDMPKYLKDGAPLILSGIINLRADEVREAVRENGYTVIREEYENDWVAMLVVRTPDGV